MAFNSDEIKREIMSFINANRVSSEKELSSQDSLKDAGIDSFKIIELILFLETRFKLPFPEDAFTAENLKSVDSILNCALKNHSS